ncbi:alpha-2,8-sialyltransferase 8F-like isoform X2 [Lampris incognitus]|uniref:alpha-2,8-sialyltransferase 8F-like isoform X2 n=1 Tax=Lampris incognitus TaxID=2546036 RepID=UPI0024B5B70D|nr:alpha-2,8-sialyltransferase 8F-like isoform X2 [Lampris incognitus]
MRVLLMKPLSSLMLIFLFLGTAFIALICNVGSHPPYHHAQKSIPSDSSELCKDYRDNTIDEVCNNITEEVVKRYSHRWIKQENIPKEFRSLLRSTCHGFNKSIITQANTPLGSTVVYDGEKRKPFIVTQKLFSVFAKDPFLNETRDTCAVVGNGGILTNSSCGEKINSAQFVIRCNLAPVENDYERDVGKRSNLVTINPSIFFQRFGSLLERRRPFVEKLHSYGDSLILLPAFSYGLNTAVSLRALYTIQDFESPTKPVFLNPEYVQSLARFWRSQGLKAVRLSTGFIMVSLALELCTNVELYGFWPFNEHPHGHQPLTNHYYDDMQSKKNVHAIPAEFEHLLRLHSQGVLTMHLGECPTTTRCC